MVTRAMALLVTLALAAPAAAVAAPHHRPRPLVKVTDASASVSGSTVTVRATVRNRGRARAERSTVRLYVDGARAASVRVAKLRPGKRRAVTVSAAIGGGSHAVKVCADRCRDLAPVFSSVPTDPLALPEGDVVKVARAGDYWVYVPTGYDDSNQTPAGLVVFGHGCGGEAEGELWSLVGSIDDRDRRGYVVMSPDLGRDGDCFDEQHGDRERLLAAIADLRTHWNVDPHRIAIGGYSSGSDLATWTAIDNARMFSGVFAINGRALPYLGNRNADLPRYAWKLNVAVRGHDDDDTYPPSEQRADQDAFVAAGFPAVLSVVPGDHGTTTGADYRWVFDRATSWVSP
jgi:dienelactone hydrolase